MKGAFNLKPPNPRYSHTWDVTVVLKYLKTLGSNNELSMKHITMKLGLLVALISGQRCQTMALMNLDYAQVTTNGVTFVINELTKTSKISKPHISVKLVAYPHDASLGRRGRAV